MFVLRDQLALCILLSFPLSVCPIAAAQNDSAAVDSCRYSLPHYDEDWTCVRSAAHQADAVDVIKYLAAGEGYYVSFGGEIRETYERFHNTDFGLQPEDSNGYLLQRYLVHADVHFTESIRGYVELLSALENWRVGGPRPFVDEDKLDVHQGFVDLLLAPRHQRELVLRIGRQEVALGSGRLVALREGTNVPLSFDGVRATAQPGIWTLDVLASKPVLNKTGIFDDPPQPGLWFWGVYSSRRLRSGTHSPAIDVYYLGLDRDPARFNRGTASETRHTIGGRLWKLSGAWNYDAEGMFQFGSFGNGDIRAWRFASDVSYGFQSVCWKPRVGLAADIASGNRNPTSSSLGTFNAFFQSGLYSGKAQILGPDNTIRVEPSVKAFASPRVSLSVGWGFYWRESVHDGLYGIANNLIVPADGSLARYEGSRPIAQVGWQLNRHLSAHVNYIFVFNGPFEQQAVHGTSSMSFVSPWVTYEF